MSVKVVNKGFKGRDEKEEKLSSLGSIIPALYGDCPGGGVPRLQGLEEVGGDVATIAQGQGRNHSPLTGFKELGNYTQVAK